MKTSSTHDRIPPPTAPPDIPDPDAVSVPAPEAAAPHPADIESADQNEALATYPRPRTITLPGREPLDLEAISDLWLD
jgi:hypothetical protein